MNNTYIYKDKPLFGLDIGFSSVKAMQIESHSKKRVVTGYGVARFDPSSIKDGVVINYEKLAKDINGLFRGNIVGEITSRRVAVALPAVRTFTRSMTLPKLDKKDLDEAVRLEAEQYIPLPVDELYMDYSVSKRTEESTELLAVAVPKKVVDSYVSLLYVLGLEPLAFDTTIEATSRLFVNAEQSDVPTILIDFGSISADLTLYNNGLIVTGTVPCGGDTFTELIGRKMGVTREEAHIIKTKYGLGVSKKQSDIIAALNPQLEKMLKEIRRMIRYYEERSDTKGKVGQIITMGGGANMPGLSEYMTNTLRLPVRMCNPWENLDFGGLQPPHAIEKSMYVTVAGLALINPKEAFTA